MPSAEVFSLRPTARGSVQVFLVRGRSMVSSGNRCGFATRSREIFSPTVLPNTPGAGYYAAHLKERADVVIKRHPIPTLPSKRFGPRNRWCSACERSHKPPNDEGKPWRRSSTRTRFPTRPGRMISSASGRRPRKTASSRASRSATWAASPRTAEIPTNSIMPPWCSIRNPRSGTPTSSGAERERRSPASSSWSAAPRRKRPGSSPPSCTPRTTSAASGPPSLVSALCRPGRARTATWCGPWPPAAPACPMPAASRSTKAPGSSPRRTPKPSPGRSRPRSAMRKPCR